jgi:hypothetical protein
MTLKAANRPQHQGFTTVPPEIKDWYASQGMRLSWQRKHDDSLSLKFGMGIQPIVVTELEVDHPEIVEVFKRFRMKITPEGYVQRQDAILCYQSQEEWEETEAAFRDRLKEREDGVADIETLEKSVQDLVKATGKGSGNPLLTGIIPKTREVVSVSKSLSTPGVQVGLNPDE